MNVEDIIWDIREIKHRLSDDSDVDSLWLLGKINSYRAIHIREEYGLNNIIDPSWLQMTRKIILTKVLSSDDPSISYGSIMLAKGTIPAVISLPDDLGVYRLSGSSGILQLEPSALNTLLMRIEIGEEIDGKYGFYARIGQTVYCWPLMSEAAAIIIAANPMDVKVFENNALRDRTFADEYPIDIAMAQKVIIDILTKDFMIMENTITDIVNDSQSQFKIMNSSVRKQ